MNKLMPKPYLVLVRRGKQYALLPQLAFSARDARDQARTELDAEFEGSYLSEAERAPMTGAKIVAVEAGKHMAGSRRTAVGRRYDLLEQLEDRAAQGMDAGQQIERLLRKHDQ